MIVIIDDDPLFAEILKENLKKYYKDNEIVVLCDFDEEFLNSNDVEILFVDIELKNGKNGIELASVYRRQGNDDVEIIFISTHENLEHRTNIAFPLYFVRKAYLRSDLIDAVSLLNERRRKKEMPFFLEGKIVKLMDLLYIESKRNDVFYHFKNGTKIKRRIGISSVEDELEKFGFLRCQQSFIVNIIYVKEYYENEFIVLKNGTKVPTTGRYHEHIMNVFMEYYNKRTQSKM